jgi:MFS family permease
MEIAIPKTVEKTGLLKRLRSQFSFIQGNFLILMTSWLILDFASETPMTYFPLFIKELGGTVATVGLIQSVQMFASAIVQIPGGYLADKYGRRWLIISMTVLAAIARIFYVVAPTWEYILFGTFIVGLCSIYQPALNAIIMDSLPKENRGLGFSIINLIAGASTTPAPLVAGFLLSKFGLVPSVRIGFIIATVGYLVAAAVRFKLTETVDNPQQINKKELVESIPTSIRESINVWKLVPKTAFYLFIVHVISMFLVGLFQPVFTVYIIEDLAIGEVNYSIIMTSLFLSMILLSIPAGKLIDKFGKKNPLIGTYLLWMLASILLIYGDFFRALVAMSLIGLLQILINSAGSALNADLVPKEHRGKTSGARGFFVMIAMAIGQLTGGFIYDNISHQLPFWLNFTLAVIPLLMIIFLVKEPKSTTSF